MAKGVYSDLTSWNRSEVETAIRLLEDANIEMAKQLEQLRSETNESFIQAGNFDTPGGKVAVSNIENFIDTDGKSFHDIMQERIANLRHISQLLGEMEQV